jgi:hypothetical protein
VKELAARLDDLFRLLTGGRCTALSSGPAALPSLKAFAGSNRILFGSDFPYVSAGIVASFTGKLDAYGDLTDDEHRAINHGNACALFSASGPKARHGAPRKKASPRRKPGGSWAGERGFATKSRERP